MRIVFFGNPKFCSHSLLALSQSNHSIVSVVTNPDKKSGRGQKVQSSPIKMKAEEYGYSILQPNDLSNNDFISISERIN